MLLALALLAQTLPPIPCAAVVAVEGQTPYCYPKPAPTPTPPPACVPQKLDGLVVDKCAHPMTALAKPALRAAVVDPEFGTTIRRISAVPESAGENAVIRPMYSTIPAWNADESKLIVWWRGNGWLLLDGKTYLPIKTLSFENPTDIEQILWDSVDPDLIYYPSNLNAIPRLMQHRVSTGVNSLVQDFTSAACPRGDWGKLLRLGADPMWLSWAPRKVIGLSCGPAKFAYDIETKKALGGLSVASTPNAPMPAPSGAQFYFDGAVYDERLVFQRSLNLASVVEHSTLGRQADGTEFYASVVFSGTDADVGTMVLHDLQTAAKRIIVGPSTGYPYPPSGTHLSGLAHRKPGLVTASVVGVKEGQRVLDQELLLADLNLGRVYRVGHHRSHAGEGRWGYWSEPHASPSPTGTRIIFASDWGGGASVDTYVVELPGYIP